MVDPVEADELELIKIRGFWMEALTEVTKLVGVIGLVDSVL